MADQTCRLDSVLLQLGDYRHCMQLDLSIVYSMIYFQVIENHSLDLPNEEIAKRLAPCDPDGLVNGGKVEG